MITLLLMAPLCAAPTPQGQETRLYVRIEYQIGAGCDDCNDPCDFTDRTIYGSSQADGFTDGVFATADNSNQGEDDFFGEWTTQSAPNDLKLWARCAESDSVCGADDERTCYLEGNPGWVFDSYADMYDQSTLDYRDPGPQCSNNDAKCPINYLRVVLRPENLDWERVTASPLGSTSEHVDFHTVFSWPVPAPQAGPVDYYWSLSDRSEGGAFDAANDPFALMNGMSGGDSVNLFDIPSGDYFMHVTPKDIGARAVQREVAIDVPAPHLEGIEDESGYGPCDGVDRVCTLDPTVVRCYVFRIVYFSTDDAVANGGTGYPAEAWVEFDYDLDDLADSADAMTPDQTPSKSRYLNGLKFDASPLFVVLPAMRYRFRFRSQDTAFHTGIESLTPWRTLADDAAGEEPCAQSAFQLLCNGDGGDQLGCTNCPCGNDAPHGTVGGCINSAGTSAQLVPSGSESIAAADLRLEASGAPPSNSCQLTSGNALAPTNHANPCFGLSSGIQSVSLDGLRCVVQGVLRHGVRPSDSNGDVGVTTNGWGSPNGFFGFGAFMSGQTKHFQIIHRDDSAAICLTGQNTSQAVSVSFAP